ncbi:MAG: HAD-IIIA family hydrolase, partial [candidate division Zixibacteria bacterium]|nr:HAD-IIIA family hydrolase [candidate division Zixibacteria bacterium]
MRNGWKRLTLNAPHTIDLYNGAIRDSGGSVYAFRPVLKLPKRNNKLLQFELACRSPAGRAGTSRNDLPTVAIAPGASFPTKQWPMEKFEALAIEIGNNLPANIVFLLSERDCSTEMIYERIPPARLRVRLNADFDELAYIVAESNLLVCNDSALSHLGSALGTPVLALFGPTHPTLGFGPRGMKDIIMQVDEFCRPCSLHGKRSCYREEQFCFTRISVADVFGKAIQILEHDAKGTKAVFIDRDGTLIKEKNYIKDPDEVEAEENAIEAVKMARRAGFKVIVISNQSGIARGLFTEETVAAVNRRVLDIFHREEAIIDDIFYCPHLPSGKIPAYSIECSCRKPAPGMIEAACAKHNINPFRSYIIGDMMSDVNLAYVVGAGGILVRTGYGREQEEKLKSSNLLKPELVADNILEGIKYIISR